MSTDAPAATDLKQLALGDLDQELGSLGRSVEAIMSSSECRRSKLFVVPGSST